ncbi:MAG: hypothetical protein HXY49_02265 [Ignavibacteriaceae bacterium]|nr:hypothetical protein [Ignavibacteriaceae bacterium]
MKFSLINILLLFLILEINAQTLSNRELDSLYSDFIKIKSYHTIADISQPLRPDSGTVKCGFSEVNSVIPFLSQFSTEKQKTIYKLLQRPQKQTSFVTPGGFFRVHFDTSGIEKPEYDLGLLAEALDSAYRFEINYLNYAVPVSDNGEGGDALYDVYILDLGTGQGGLYGYTQYSDQEIVPGSGRYTSYMVIDEDYLGFKSAGIQGARVTVAHEFHHAIQGSGYIFRQQDTFFHELSSTAMEEFVFDSINDYYGYMLSYFRSPENPFAQNNGYNLAIWNIFIHKNFGFEILKRQWELMPGLRALNAINLSLNELGTTFAKQLNKFGVWTYFTKFRAQPNNYFEEGEFYPLIDIGAVINFSPPSREVNLNVKSTSNNFITLKDQSTGDTLIAIITNGDYISGIDSINKSFPLEYILFTDPNSGERKLTSHYSSDFNVNNNRFLWSASELLNGILVREDSAQIPLPEKVLEYAFPNPFYYMRGLSDINLPVATSNSGTAIFNIYTIAMELVFTGEGRIINNNGKAVVLWDGFDDKKNKLPSGVYIYVTKADDEITKGKIVIFNE